MTDSDTKPVHNNLGFVIPVYNEEATINDLHAQICGTLDDLGISQFDICFVDDGSTDNSWKVIREICESDPTHTSGLRFRRNFGKADALQAGFDVVKGDIIFTLDADLQDDPKEIPAFLKKLDDGYDMVSGWKKVRHDPVDKTLPSRIFNALARRASGVQLHDFNCGFKAYRRVVTENIQLFGELHRFVPILADAEGFTVGEIPVEHHPRRHGVSKYGSKRYLKGLLDLMTVIVISRYLKRPAHIFGGAGIFIGITGFSILLYMSLNKLLNSVDIGGRPLFFLGILLLLLGAQLLSLGLIAEMITRQTRSNPGRRVAESTPR
jgi:glycosyltransferase involved in cell wall biosynthesis